MVTHYHCGGGQKVPLQLISKAHLDHDLQMAPCFPQLICIGLCYLIDSSKWGDRHTVCNGTITIIKPIRIKWDVVFMLQPCARLLPPPRVPGLLKKACFQWDSHNQQKPSWDTLLSSIAHVSVPSHMGTRKSHHRHITKLLQTNFNHTEMSHTHRAQDAACSQI